MAASGRRRVGGGEWDDGEWDGGEWDGGEYDGNAETDDDWNGE
jgi:hypothetical protein